MAGWVKTQHTLFIEGKSVFARRQGPIVVEDLFQEALINVPGHGQVSMLVFVFRVPTSAPHKHSLAVTIFLNRIIR
jgi:hypothetical protein